MPSSYVFSEADHEDFHRAVEAADYRRAFEILSKHSELRERVTELKNRFNRLTKDRQNNYLTREKHSTELTLLTAAILETYRPYQPLVSSTEDSPQAITSAYRLQSAADGLLQPSQDILGREEAVKSAAARLAMGECLLVHGPGGMGKTEFCRLLLQTHLTAHPEEIWYWIDVEFITSEATLIGIIAQTLNLDERSSQETVLHALRERPVHYYLDNLESISSNQERTPFLKQFTRHSRGRVLASSREMLPAFRGIELSELPDAVGLELFRNLWAKAAADPNPEFPEELTEFTKTDLGNHPLSITLAASRAYDFTEPTALIAAWRADKAEARRLFAGDHDNRLENLDRNVEVSYLTLQEYPDARRLWLLCSLFPEGMSGADYAFFEDECGLPLAARALLLRRSVLRIRAGHLGMVPHFVRFIQRMAGEETRQKVLDDGHRFAMDDPDKIGTDNRVWYERWNFTLQYLGYFYDRTDHVTYETVFKTALNTWARTPLRSRSVLKQVAENTRQDSLRANALLNLGEVEFRLGHNEQAVQHFHNAEKLYRKTQSEQGRANALLNLGEVAVSEEKYSKASELFREAEQLSRKTGYVNGILLALTEAGKLAATQKDRVVMDEKFGAALELARELGNYMSWVESTYSAAREQVEN